MTKRKKGRNVTGEAAIFLRAILEEERHLSRDITGWSARDLGRFLEAVRGQDVAGVNLDLEGALRAREVRARFDGAHAEVERRRKEAAARGSAGGRETAKENHRQAALFWRGRIRSILSGDDPPTNRTALARLLQDEHGKTPRRTLLNELCDEMGALKPRRARTSSGR